MPIFEIGALDAETLEPITGTIEAPSLRHLECLNLQYLEMNPREPYYEWAFEVPTPDPQDHEVRNPAEWQELVDDYGRNCPGL